MKASPPGWYDAGRWRELTSVVGIISSRNAYKPSPNVVSWEPALPGDCTELTVWAERLLIALGWPAEILERWTCRTTDGKAHAVLIAHLTLASGTAATVIDCRHPTPMRRVDLSYTRWVRLMPR